MELFSFLDHLLSADKKLYQFFSPVSPIEITGISNLISFLSFLI